MRMRRSAEEALLRAQSVNLQQQQQGASEGRQASASTSVSSGKDNFVFRNSETPDIFLLVEPKDRDLVGSQISSSATQAGSRCVLTSAAAESVQTEAIHLTVVRFYLI